MQNRHDKTRNGYALFCMVRPWLIVFATDRLLRIRSLARGAMILRAYFTRLDPRALLSKTVTSYGLSKYEFLLLFAALLIWLAVSIWEEKGKDMRAYLAEKPVLLRWSCYYGIVLLLLITGIYGGNYDTAAFLYQSF